MGSDSLIGADLFDAADDDDFVLTKREFDRMLDLIMKFDHGDDHQRSNLIVSISNQCWSVVTNAMAHRAGAWARMDTLGLPDSDAHDTDD